MLSMVPTNFIEAVSAQSSRPSLRDVSPGANVATYALYVVDVQGFEELTMPGVEIVGDETLTEAILGRDVVNRLRITLDGHRQQLRVES